MDFLFQGFIARSLFAGVLLALPLSLMGCFMVWRRMVFLSDTLSHGAVLGVALGLFIHLNPYVAVMAVALLLSFVLSQRDQGHYLSQDVWMSIMSYGSLSLGLILLALNREVRVDPDSILFGDVLGVSPTDLMYLSGIAVLVALVSWWNWRVWLMLSLDEELSQTSGISVNSQRFIMIGMIALVIAIGMKIIGALLLPALLILPAATVSRLSKTPEQMVLFTFFAFLGTYFLGFYTSFQLDLPTGPAIVISSIAIFFLSVLFKRKTIRVTS